MSEITQEELVADRWVNRRSMAWASLLSLIVLIVYTVVVMSPDEAQMKGDVLEWAFISLASIVGAYMGLATWAERRK